MRQDLDTCTPHGDDIRTLCSVTYTREQVGVAVRNNEAADEDTGDVEEEDTPEDSANGFLDVGTRILGLRSGDGDELDSLVRKRGLNEASDNGQKSTECARLEVFVHRARVLPITETNSVCRHEG